MLGPITASRVNPDMVRLCVIEGDGIGKEVIPCAVHALQAVLPQLEIVRADAGWECFQRTGSSVPFETICKVRDCGAALFGAVSSPTHKVVGYRSAILTLRQELGLYANIRPVCSLPRLSPRQDVNLVIVRENTEGLYVGRETLTELADDEKIAIAERVISSRASQRVARQALHLAFQTGRKRITIVHKANILPLTDGLFRDSIRQVAEVYFQEIGQTLQIDEMLVDTAAYQIINDPQRFEMILTTNLFGDILSDVAAYWGGGLGFSAALNWGDEAAIAEPVHGSAPDIAGRGIANPIAAILSAALLVRYAWGLQDESTRIESAVQQALAHDLPVENGRLPTSCTTEQIFQSILRYL